MLLAIDTSTQSVGLALFDGAQILGEMIWQTHNHHTVEIAPAVDATRSFLVKISLLNPPENVALGVTADVRLPQTHTANAHWLPASALFQEAKQPAVWVVDANHQVKTQAVEVLAYQENGITVSGLSKGMQVIAAGVHQLSTGQTINPIPYDGKASP